MENVETNCRRPKTKATLILPTICCAHEVRCPHAAEDVEHVPGKEGQRPRDHEAAKLAPQLLEVVFGVQPPIDRVPVLGRSVRRGSGAGVGRISHDSTFRVRVMWVTDAQKP